MMKVILTMRINSCIADCSSNDVYLVRIFELPFAPFVGLEVGEQGWSEIIKETYYDIGTGEFTCYIEPDKEYYNKGFKGLGGGMWFPATKKEMEEKVNGYLEEGWSRRSK